MPDELRQKLYDYRQEGYTASEIAKLCNADYRRYSRSDMTRNVVIGQWNRMGLAWTKPNRLPTLKKFVAKENSTSSNLDVSSRDVVKSPDKYRERKCLKCGKVKVMLKQHFRCESCKHNDNDELRSCWSGPFTW